MDGFLNSLVVIIPALNEAATLGGVLSALGREVVEASVIVVNDAGDDSTEEVVIDAGGNVLTLATRLGPWGATQAGIRRACELGFENVVTMDADGQHLPESVTRLTSAMRKSGADIVVGSAPGRSKLRTLAWKMMRLVSGLEITDLTSGFRLYSRKAMNLLADERASYLQYQDIGILALALEHELQIVEVDVDTWLPGNGVFREYLTPGFL